MVVINQTTLGLDPGCVRSVADYLQKTRNTRAVSANKLSLLSICSFRMSVLGGFATSMGGKPFLLPRLSQLALGFPSSSMNSIACADMDAADTAIAITMASTLQKNVFELWAGF